LNFYKTISQSAISTAITILVGLIITKITSTIIGPNGTFINGQFSAYQSLLILIGTGLLGNGLVRQVSEHKENAEKVKEIVRTALSSSLILGAIVVLITLVCYNTIGNNIMNRSEYNYLFIIQAALLIFASYNYHFQATLNSLQKIKKYAIANIVVSCLSLVTILALIFQYRIHGILFALLLTQFLMFIFYLFFLKNEAWFSCDLFYPKWNKEILKLMIAFIPSMLIIMVNPYNLMVIRSGLEHKFNQETAGIWTAMMLLSERYMSILITFIGIYYVPKLIELKSDQYMFIREVRKGFKRLIPLVIIFSFLIWLCRDWIILIILSPAFKPMEPLFLFQTIGDVFKVIAYFMAITLYVKDKLYKYIALILIFEISLFFTIPYFSDHYGIIGATYGYAISTIIYFLVALVFLWETIIDVKKSVLPNSLKSDLGKLIKK
jgi:O-antigen/teichoic acid export membrane protein